MFLINFNQIWIEKNVLIAIYFLFGSTPKTLLLKIHWSIVFYIYLSAYPSFRAINKIFILGKHFLLELVWHVLKKLLSLSTHIETRKSLSIISIDISELFSLPFIVSAYQLELCVRAVDIFKVYKYMFDMSSYSPALENYKNSLPAHMYKDWDSKKKRRNYCYHYKKKLSLWKEEMKGSRTNCTIYKKNPTTKMVQLLWIYAHCLCKNRMQLKCEYMSEKRGRKKGFFWCWASQRCLVTKRSCASSRADIVQTYMQATYTPKKETGQYLGSKRTYIHRFFGRERRDDRARWETWGSKNRSSGEPLVRYSIYWGVSPW